MNTDEVAVAGGNLSIVHVVERPIPEAARERGVIKRLIDAATIVIACGSGGETIHDSPMTGAERIVGVFAEGLAAAVLTRDLRAALLLIHTDVDAVIWIGALRINLPCARGRRRRRKGWTGRERSARAA